MKGALFVFLLLFVVVTWICAAEAGYMKRLDDLNDQPHLSYATKWWVITSAISALGALSCGLVLACM